MSDTEVNFAGLVNNKSGVDEMGPETKELPALFVKSVDQGNRQITALASAATLDRYDEVMLPEAFRELLPVYMKNPVVLTSHQHRLTGGHSSVIGSTIKAWIDSQGLWVVIEFATGTTLAEEYWQLYSQKKQRALSVGYIPIESRYEERDGKSVLVHTKIELLEISVCAVPANREALTKSQQRKADWLEEKKYEAEEEKILAELRKEDPDFDAKAEEFAEAILSGEYDGGEEGEDSDFAGIVSGENEKSFVELVQGR